MRPCKYSTHLRTCIYITSALRVTASSTAAFTANSLPSQARFLQQAAMCPSHKRPATANRSATTQPSAKYLGAQSTRPVSLKVKVSQPFVPFPLLHHHGTSSSGGSSSSRTRLDAQTFSHHHVAYPGIDKPPLAPNLNFGTCTTGRSNQAKRPAGCITLWPCRCHSPSHPAILGRHCQVPSSPTRGVCFPNGQSWVT